MRIIKKQNQGRRAVIYTRVSTDEQKENGFSLPDQYNKLVNFCKKNEYEIVEHYQDDHSAKSFDRPAFQRFLKDIKNRKILVDTFICVRPDRFSRNLENTLSMLSEFKKLNLKFITVENHSEIDTPESYLPFIIHNLLPQIENERRGLNTKQGMRQALKEGRWLWKAPIGYKNNTITKLVEIDQNTAPFVQSAFKQLATGAFLIEEVRQNLMKNGFKGCSKQGFLNLVRNSFYCGLITVPEWKDEEEMCIKGLHEPIISEELFFEVQNILNGRKKNYQSQITQNDYLLLRGHLVCNICGGKITGSGSSSRNKVKHYYYHCQKGCKERFRADSANETFEQFLNSFQISDNVLNLYYLILKDVFEQDDIEKTSQIRDIDKKLELLIQRQGSVSEKFMDNAISPDEYRKLVTRLENEENELSRRKKELSRDPSSYRKYFDYGLAFMSNMAGYYNSAPKEVKTKIVGSIFPEKLIFDHINYRTTRKNELLELLTSNINSFGGYKKEKADGLVGFSSLAPQPGLEPGT